MTLKTGVVGGGARGPNRVRNLPGVQALVIATPAATPHESRQKALADGEVALVEKPVGTATSEVKDLLQKADRQRRALRVARTSRTAAAGERPGVARGMAEGYDPGSTQGTGDGAAAGRQDGGRRRNQPAGMGRAPEASEESFP